MIPYLSNINIRATQYREERRRINPRKQKHFINQCKPLIVEVDLRIENAILYITFNIRIYVLICSYIMTIFHTKYSCLMSPLVYYRYLIIKQKRNIAIKYQIPTCDVGVSAILSVNCGIVSIFHYIRRQLSQKYFTSHNLSLT